MRDPTKREVLYFSVGPAALGLTDSLSIVPCTVADEVREEGCHGYSIGDIDVTAIHDGV